MENGLLEGGEVTRGFGLEGLDLAGFFSTQRTKIVLAHDKFNILPIFLRSFLKDF